MKGFRFYVDHKGTEYEPGEHGFPRGKLPSGINVARLRLLADSGVKANVVALLIDDEHRAPNGDREALAAVFAHPDSDTAVTMVAAKYLRRCKRIPEAVARKLHPRLFARLDAED